MNSAMPSLVLILLLQLAPAETTPQSPPTKADICEIAHNPAKFIGRHVVFHAEILADGMHGALLKDHEEKCFVNFATSSKHQSAMEQNAGAALEKAIFQGDPGTGADKRIEGDFGGILLMEVPSFGPSKNKRPSLRLESLENLKITEISTSPK